MEVAFHLRDRILTQTARLLRTTGDRSILVVACFASVYALLIFAQDVYKPNSPKSSHDAILKGRFSSPAASDRIIILDIDERSIATMADMHGRWPWRRDVLAESLQKVADFGASGVMFNILLAEPDKQSPDADGLMNYVAQSVQNSAYPIVRLAEENDKDSQLKVALLPGSTVDSTSQDKTIAVIIPMFSGMQDRLGVTNQRPDADGIVRKYPYAWVESGFKLPSIVQTTLFVSGEPFEKNAPDLFSLNWRNKEGSYKRISFSDLFLDKLSEAEKASLRKSIVVVGVSAPGVGQTKPTSVKPIADDNEILATALDDAMNGTYLRIPSAWVLLVLNLASIWLLYITFSHKTGKSPPLNRLFVVLQAGLGGVTLLSASYTNYLVDLTDPMKFGLGVFGAIKLAQSLDDRWSRGRKGYRKVSRSILGEAILIVSYFEKSLRGITGSGLQREIERLVGVDHVVRIDDLFSGESFLKTALSTCHGLIICVPSGTEKSAIQTIFETYGLSEISQRTVELGRPWDLEDKAVAEMLSPAVIATIGDLLDARSN